MTAQQIQEGEVFAILEYRFLDLTVITYMPVSTDICLALVLSYHRYPNVGFDGHVLIPVIRCRI